MADGAGTRRVPLPREVAQRRREPGGLAVFLAAVVFYPLTWFLARRRMVGLENVPAEGPALLVCNHVSYLDPVYTAVFVHRSRRTPRFLAKDSLWRVPVFGRIMAGSRQIPVARGSRDAGSSLAAAEAAFDDDGVVVIYPEGTITRDPAGWPMDARSGAARLALTHGVPVIPVVHWGTLQVYDHYRKRFRPSPFGRSITVRAGTPIELDDLRARVGDRAPGARLMKETTDRLMAAVTALLEDVRGEARPAGEA
ncbi:lysophospholipid acyltransferase family protein [Actinomycetospora termitidis]|uniref:Lysophospholipid acyltransferase family protein n=1 Tax=Actinomycetospora termitidis TaxID=3053470 RepID=A0ABT7M5G3_9PSEU|nr:lysophospholipid acyltransferase family protein [Actinomycetospora sp. Odt1-22]MDL5155920.1 lysophospholipid acyltransferase family protein [Actinomycetospora sp. Odt1-22]